MSEQWHVCRAFGDITVAGPCGPLTHFPILPASLMPTECQAPATFLKEQSLTITQPVQPVNNEYRLIDFRLTLLYHPPCRRF
jgi:hypothetical protein